MNDQPRMTTHGRVPRLQAPPGTCDTHSHVYGPRERYPHVPGRTPDLVAELDAYRQMLARLRIERAVIVQPSLYGFDNRATLDAVAAMGPERARGVAVCRPDTPMSELRALDGQGIRGLRVFLLVDDLVLADVPALGRSCAELGWHLVVQGRDDWLDAAAPVLERCPCPVVIDHLGRTPPEAGVDNAWVKISAPYLSSRAGPPHYADCGPRVRALIEARADRLLWAANWPHPNSPLGAKPDEADCLDPLLEWVADEATRELVLARNAGRLYGFE